MMVAQKLYEAGRITYMRTDSVNLSEIALDAAEKQINGGVRKKLFAQTTIQNKI